MRHATILAALLLLPMIVSAQSDSVDTPAKKESKTLRWQDDPHGQFVFFAVLEGLFRDGVSNEVVDLVINPKKGPDDKIKHCFVIQCEICHAAYEAFVLYRRRKVFDNSGERSTFGKGVDKKFKKGLESSSAGRRVRTLGRMMRPWIVSRANKMIMSEEEKIELIDKLMKFKGEADNLLSNFRSTDPSYKDWSFYGACQACEAATTISHTLKANQTNPKGKEDIKAE